MPNIPLVDVPRPHQNGKWIQLWNDVIKSIALPYYDLTIRIWLERDLEWKKNMDPNRKKKHVLALALTNNFSTMSACFR